MSLTPRDLALRVDTKRKITAKRRSDGADLVRLRALGALAGGVLHLLVLREAAVAAHVDRRVVNEDVGAAVIGGDEAEALVGVKPLHGARAHVLCLLRGDSSSEPRGRAAPAVAVRHRRKPPTQRNARVRTPRAFSRSQTSTTTDWYSVAAAQVIPGLFTMLGRVGRPARSPASKALPAVPKISPVIGPARPDGADEEGDDHSCDEPEHVGEVGDVAGAGHRVARGVDPLEHEPQAEYEPRGEPERDEEQHRDQA